MRLFVGGCLSRGSAELHHVDLSSWQVTSTLSLTAGGSDQFDDAINLEVLDNGQVLVVFNRYDRLRVFEVTGNSSQITEVDVRSSAAAAQGFDLPLGRGVQLSAVAQAAGKYRLFMATPGIHAVTVHDYDPIARTLVVVRDTTSAEIVISRSRFSNPFYGGHLKTPGTQTFYFSTDRNGFLTWVNTQTLQSGFIDLADALPDVSRNSLDAGFANPNDNSFDSVRVIDVDDSHIAVLNNRQASVLLRLEANPDGVVTVAGTSVLPPAVGGSAVTVESGIKLIGTIVGSFSPNMQTSGLVVNHLQTRDAAGTLESTGFDEVITAIPVLQIATIQDNLVVEYSGEARSLIQVGTNGTRLQEIPLPTSFRSADSTEFTLSVGATFTYQDTVTGKSYRMVTAKRADTIDRSNQHLLILNISDIQNIQLVGHYDVQQLARIRTGTASANEIILLDRLGGEMLTIANWQTPQNAEISVYQFHQERIREFGESRPAHVVIMPDGTRVTMHDTTPDRGVSVFDADKPMRDQQLARFHANNTGSFSFDLQVFDQDRLVAVTYSGEVVIQNIRTGIIEADQHLSDTDGVAVNVAATENFSYRSGTLLVNTPSTQTVGVYHVDHNGAAAPASPLRVFRLADVVMTAVDSSG